MSIVGTLSLIHDLRRFLPTLPSIASGELERSGIYWDPDKETLHAYEVNLCGGKWEINHVGSISWLNANKPGALDEWLQTVCRHPRVNVGVGNLLKANIPGDLAKRICLRCFGCQHKVRKQDRCGYTTRRFTEGNTPPPTSWPLITIIDKCPIGRELPPAKENASATAAQAMGEPVHA